MRKVRVDMVRLSVTSEEINGAAVLLGGRALTSSIVAAEVEPTTDPLGPGNKLVFAPGTLTGTTVPTSGRLSVGARSPLTGGIKESNVGGTAAQKFARLGIRALIIEGIPAGDEWYVLKVDRSGVSFLPAGSLKGLGNYDTMCVLAQEYGPGKAFITIGPAGEMGLGIASIAVTDMDGRPTRHAGRGGLGAVMGSKRIKAIILDDQGAEMPRAKDEETFKALVAKFAKDTAAAKQTLTRLGTANLVKPVNALGGLPTRNYSKGQFEGADRISGERLAELIAQRGGRTGHPCHPGCVIRCSNVFNDAGGNHLTSALEYETIVLLGSNLEIDDLDVIAEMDRFCDNFGVDTMETGHALAVAMEAGLAPFGDKAAALDLLEEIRRQTTLGKVLGQGATVAARVLGVKRVAAVKGQGMAAYDPRIFKGTGVTYATSPMGADHTAGNCLPGRGGYHHDNRLALETTQVEGQDRLSHDIQVLTGVMDALGMCFFAGATYENVCVLAEMTAALYAIKVGPVDLLDMAEECILREREFNRKAGFTEAHDRLPEFMRKEPLSPRDQVFDVPDVALDRVFKGDQ